MRSVAAEHHAESQNGHAREGAQGLHGLLPLYAHARQKVVPGRRHLGERLGQGRTVVADGGRLHVRLGRRGQTLKRCDHGADRVDARPNDLAPISRAPPLPVERGAGEVADGVRFTEMSALGEMVAKGIWGIRPPHDVRHQALALKFLREVAADEPGSAQDVDAHTESPCGL